MNLKSWHFLCLLFICLSVCQCNKEEEGDLKGTEEEEELVVAAIYKVATQLTRIRFDYRYTQMHNNVFNEHITPGKQREAEKAAEADGGHLVEAHGGPLPHHSDSLGQGPYLASIHLLRLTYGMIMNQTNIMHAGLLARGEGYPGAEHRPPSHRAVGFWLPACKGSPSVCRSVFCLQKSSSHLLTI